VLCSSTIGTRRFGLENDGDRLLLGRGIMHFSVLRNGNNFRSRRAKKRVLPKSDSTLVLWIKGYRACERHKRRD
jgi:hypothetical protein